MSYKGQKKVLYWEKKRETDEKRKTYQLREEFNKYEIKYVIIHSSYIIFLFWTYIIYTVTISYDHCIVFLNGTLVNYI